MPAVLSRARPGAHSAYLSGFAVVLLIVRRRYAIRFGFQSGVLKPFKPYGVPLSETLIPQRLKQLGYATHAIVSPV